MGRTGWIKAAGVLAGMAAALPAAAQGPGHRPVVAELFTSEGCSSCPPAEALAAELAATRPDVLVLAFHVTYWDNLGWRDPFALPEATARQQAYDTHFGLDGLYTPQLVVDGARDVVGNDRPAVLAALRQAAQAAPPAVMLDLTRIAGGVRLAAGAGAGRGNLLLVGFDSAHRTRVARGENAGRVLAEANIVRELRELGGWRGAALQLQAPAPAGEHLAALLQAPDGRILGAAVME